MFLQLRQYNLQLYRLMASTRVYHTVLSVGTAAAVSNSGAGISSPTDDPSMHNILMVI